MLGVDSDHRTHVLHQYPSRCSLFEGKRLSPAGPIPLRDKRVLTMVLDLNTGEELDIGSGVE